MAGASDHTIIAPEKLVEIGEIDPKGKLSLVPVLEDGTTPAAE